MTKVLVTGATGFIGSHLVKSLLAKRQEVTCLVRESSSVAPLKALGVRLLRGDITDRQSLRDSVVGQDVVYQLAGCLRALSPKQLYRVNEEGVRNLAQACAEQPTPPVLVTVSSLAAAGSAVEDRPRREDDPPAPVSHYGRSKLAGERAARQFAGTVPITVVRPPVVFGEGDPAMRAVFSMIARFSLHLVPGTQPHRFSVIHADDLVHLMVLAAERGRRLQPAGQEDGHPGGGSCSQGIYFAGCEENPTFAELGRLIGTAVGRTRVLLVPTANPLVWTIGAMSEVMAHLRHHPFYFNLDKAREATAGSWLCSPRAAMDELNFSVAMPLPQRLYQTAQRYRENGWM